MAGLGWTGLRASRRRPRLCALASLPTLLLPMLSSSVLASRTWISSVALDAHAPMMILDWNERMERERAAMRVQCAGGRRLARRENERQNKQRDRLDAIFCERRVPNEEDGNTTTTEDTTMITATAD